MSTRAGMNTVIDNRKEIVRVFYGIVGEELYQKSSYDVGKPGHQSLSI